MDERVLGHCGRKRKNAARSVGMKGRCEKGLAASAPRQIAASTPPPLPLVLCQRFGAQWRVSVKRLRHCFSAGSFLIPCSLPSVATAWAFICPVRIARHQSLHWIVGSESAVTTIRRQYHHAFHRRSVIHLNLVPHQSGRIFNAPCQLNSATVALQAHVAPCTSAHPALHHVTHPNAMRRQSGLSVVPKSAKIQRLRSKYVLISFARGGQAFCPPQGAEDTFIGTQSSRTTQDVGNYNK